jgi:hypothetical protein
MKQLRHPSEIKKEMARLESELSSSIDHYLKEPLWDLSTSNPSNEIILDCNITKLRKILSFLSEGKRLQLDHPTQGKHNVEYVDNELIVTYVGGLKDAKSISIKDVYKYMLDDLTVWFYLKDDEL